MLSNPIKMLENVWGQTITVSYIHSSVAATPIHNCIYYIRVGKSRKVQTETNTSTNHRFVRERRWVKNNYLCTYYLYGPVRKGFYKGKSITRAIVRGWPWKLRLFGDLKWLQAKPLPFGPQKVKGGWGGSAVNFSYRTVPHPPTPASAVNLNHKTS